MDRYIEMDNNPSLEGLAELVPDIVFSHAAGTELKLSLILPQAWYPEYHIAVAPYPLVVFLQGSGWTMPNNSKKCPQLCSLASKGYAVAMITHRNPLDGHPFPSYLQDAKTAIRFLRANAETYHLDPERVCFFGTSSGGNTALLVGLTPNEKRYSSEEYSDQRDDVQLVIDCFGPSCMLEMPEQILLHYPPLAALSAGRGRQEVLLEMSPTEHINDSPVTPPMLLIHGDADYVVPYSQSEKMCALLSEQGVETTLVRIRNAPHAGNFWSPALWDLISDYLDEHLKK